MPSRLKAGENRGREVTSKNLKSTNSTPPVEERREFVTFLPLHPPKEKEKMDSSPPPYSLENFEIFISPLQKITPPAQDSKIFSDSMASIVMVIHRATNLFHYLV